MQVTENSVLDLFLTMFPKLFHNFTFQNKRVMTAIELKKQLIDRIAVIDDVSFLKAMKTILDAKSSSQKLSLTDNQISEILESKKQIASGLVTEQDEIDKKFEKWLNEK